MNTQVKESLGDNGTGLIEVHSIFHTLQGEGPFAGHRAVFLRLAGCNLQCPGCDTQYTAGRMEFSVVELCGLVGVASIEGTDPDDCNNLPLVVITGGEPFRQDIRELVIALTHCGYKVQIETNGTIYRSLPFDHKNLTIVCSPKTGAISSALRKHITAYKYVVEAGCVSKSNGLPTSVLGNKVNIALPDLEKPVYIQPLDSGNADLNKRNTAAAVDSCLRFGHILCLQLHKLVGLE